MRQLTQAAAPVVGAGFSQQPLLPAASLPHASNVTQPPIVSSAGAGFALGPGASAVAAAAAASRSMRPAGLGAAGSCSFPCGPLGKLVDCLGMRGLARKGPRRMLRRRRGTIRSAAAGLRLIPAPFDLVPLAPPHPSNPPATPPHSHPAVAYISGICLLVVVAVCLIMVACILRR